MSKNSFFYTFFYNDGNVLLLFFLRRKRLAYDEVDDRGVCLRDSDKILEKTQPPTGPVKVM